MAMKATAHCHERRKSTAEASHIPKIKAMTNLRKG
jgi:hypothetical protein